MDKRFKRILTDAWSDAFTSGTFAKTLRDMSMDPFSVEDTRYTLDSRVQLCSGLNHGDGDAWVDLSDLKASKLSEATGVAPEFPKVADIVKLPFKLEEIGITLQPLEHLVRQSARERADGCVFRGLLLHLTADQIHLAAILIGHRLV